MLKKVMLMILVIFFLAPHQIEAKGGRGGGGKSKGGHGGKSSGGGRGYGGKNRGHVGRGVFSRSNRFPGLESYSFSSSFDGFGMGLGAGMSPMQRTRLIFQENLRHRSGQDVSDKTEMNTTKCYSTSYTAFIKEYEYFEPEELYLEEGNETCSGVDDVCIGHLSLIQFGLTTTAHERINGLKVNVVKGCQSLENVWRTTMMWQDNSTCLSSYRTYRNYFSLQNLQNKELLKDINESVPLKIPKTLEDINEYTKAKERKLNELKNLSKAMEAALVMNLGELRNLFHIYGQIDTYFEFDQSEMCYCRGDLCNTATIPKLESIFLVVCILVQICWSSVFKNY